MPLLTLSCPPLALGLVFPLQMACSLLSTMGQALRSLLPSLLQLPAQASAYLFVQNLAGTLSQLVPLHSPPMCLFQFPVLEEMKKINHVKILIKI